MKKTFFILLAVAVFIFLSSFLISPAITFFAKNQLKTIFKGSEVAIASCRFNPLKELSLFEITIKNEPAYDFLIKEVRVDYNLFSIFKSEIQKVSLKDAKVDIHLPQDTITAFSQYLNLGSKGVFRLQSAELSNVSFNLKAEDFNLSGGASLQANLVEKSIDYCDIKIDSLDLQGLHLSDLSFNAAQGSSEGRFRISQIKYNKLNISEIKSQARLSGKELFLDNVSADVFNGKIGGHLKLKLDLDFRYEALIKMTNLDIAKIINDLDLKEKLEMTGRLSGDLALKGQGPSIEILNGNLSNLESGGMLIIKDTKFLEDMASGTNQSLDLLVENFKNYHYNIATLKLFLDNNNLTLDTALDGETGKRNINIILHDFK